MYIQNLYSFPVVPIESKEKANVLKLRIFSLSETKARALRRGLQLGYNRGEEIVEKEEKKRNWSKQVFAPWSKQIDLLQSESVWQQGTSPSRA
mmetsp:Transcript_5600/g.7871  ORF Transcript_5600/g.7871 Transcript_5600/m.7871 type:complete len:93 (-) Transcript_5600:641-919(-)